MTENMNNIVLVPTDFTEVGDNAISQAAEAAKFLNYKVVVLHVIDRNTKTQLKKESQDSKYIEEKLAEIVDHIKQGKCPFKR